MPSNLIDSIPWTKVKSTAGIGLSIILLFLCSLYSLNYDTNNPSKANYLDGFEFSITDGNTYEVVDVVDGDTIKINMDGTVESIRLIGIDTPEVGDCYYTEATDALVKLIGIEEIYLEFDESQGQRDRYNRLLAYVWAGGSNANLHLVEEGFAEEYTYSNAYKYHSEFRQAEEYAISGEKGRWGNCLVD